MKLRFALINRAKGDDLSGFWMLYRLRQRAGPGLRRGVLSVLLLRAARRHGGDGGPGAVIRGRPVLPHGLHGIFISQYGENCRIYQNVTISEAAGRAPRIGPDCLIGAGAVLVGGIRLGRGVKVGAGAVVARDVPDHCTVVAPPPRFLVPGGGPGFRPGTSSPGSMKRTSAP